MHSGHVNVLVVEECFFFSARIFCGIRQSYDFRSTVILVAGSVSLVLRNVDADVRTAFVTV